ncbi:MAG: Tol-Pal system beta propeller repeat protein TolB [Nitrospirota bacterium]
MNTEYRSQNTEVRINKILLFLSCILYLVSCILPTVSEAKVYIDITSPAFKKFPIAIQELSGISGKEVSDIIKGDLEFTGIFEYIDSGAYIEDHSQPFNPQSWKPLGVEAVLKGSVKEDQDLSVTIFLYDVLEGKEIFKKVYRTNKEFIRSLSHAISNDIYYALTGEKGVFRTRIAFVAKNEGKMGLYIMDWDGNRIIKLGPTGNIILPPRWSRDGTKLIYSAERNRQWGIYILDFVQLNEKKVFFSNGTNIVGDFFPSGNEFSFSSSKDGTPDIYIKDTKEDKIIKLTSSYSTDVSPAVSPDGKYIAFVSDRGGSPQIYIINKDGSDIRRLTFEGSYNTSPIWSPKGDRIAFVGRVGTNQIFIIRPDGTELLQLTTSGNNEDPSFSPDGRYITLSSDRDGSKGIYIMRANGEYQKRITPKNIRAYGPRWSLD